MSVAWVAVGTIVGAGVGAATGNALTNQAGPDGRTALDINKLISDARTNAAANLQNSQSLEAKYLPGTAALRTQSDSALSDQLTGNSATLKARNGLFGDLGKTNPLLQQSSESILNQLRLGGRIDPETQNAVMRGALQKSGTAGISGSGASRGLVARDLGLTSMGLLNQRQQAAQTSGMALSSDLAQRAGVLNSFSQSDASRTAGIAGLVDARAMPEAGLSAGSIADITIAENNAANQDKLDQAKLKMARRQQKINAILGFASLGAGIGSQAAGGGGGGGKKSTYTDLGE